LVLPIKFYCIVWSTVNITVVVSAAGVVRHCQNEVTAESITLLQFCSNVYVLEMEVSALNFKTVLNLLLTILTVLVNIDVLDVLYVF